MKARHGFASFLGPDIERFIAHKRSAGRRYQTEEKSLRLLDDFLIEAYVNTFGQRIEAAGDRTRAADVNDASQARAAARAVIGMAFWP